MRRTIAAVALVLLAVACGGGPSSGPRSSALAAGDVLVRFGDRTIDAEVASTPSERALGLMNRSSMPEDAGMLFIFKTTRFGGFWMKNTLIPLSIAYLSGPPDAYRVEAILDMEPCRADPCRHYVPGVAYQAAVEVNQGWFEDAGVEIGDPVTVEGDLPTPS